MRVFAALATTLLCTAAALGADRFAVAGSTRQGRALQGTLTTAAQGEQLAVTLTLDGRTLRGSARPEGQGQAYTLRVAGLEPDQGGMAQTLGGSPPAGELQPASLLLQRQGAQVRVQLFDAQGAPLAQLEGRLETPAGAGLSAAQRAAIGRKIWENECGGRVEGLTTWNQGEEFPSLGIGHFIWYPAGFQGPFRESFPELVRFAQAQGAQDLPQVALTPHAPWNSKREFDAARHGPRLTALREWLAQNVELQTAFIVQRSREALPGILAAAPPAERARVQANYDKVASTPNGTYALIDYVNFKGEGTSPQERYQGQGWGLLHVLQDMRDVPAGQPAAREFAAAAIRVLDRRVSNAPAARGERRWSQGWRNRCRSYAQPLSD